MTYLELCQELMREAGISGSIGSVTGQIGELGRVVNWIAKAHRYIQNKHSDWEFLRRDLSFPALVDEARYSAESAAVTDFGDWRFAGRWRTYATEQGVIDEQALIFTPYDRFRDTYLFSANQLMPGRPQLVTQAPDQSLILWPKPDAAYTIVGEQYRSPLILARDDDVPLFPARFHDAIVYRALMFYGEYEGDGNTFNTGQAECNRYLQMLESEYLPEWENQGSMA